MVSAAAFEGRTSIRASGDVVAPDGPANFIVQAVPQDVAVYVRQGNDLLIGMRSGETIRIQGFTSRGFSYNNLILSHDGSHAVVDLSNALASAATEGALASNLIVVEGIGNGLSLSSLLSILGAVGLAGGTALSAGIDLDEEGSTGAPLPSAPALNPGALLPGGFTNSNRPTFTGVDAEPGARIEIRDSKGNVLGSGTVKSDGSWSVTLDRPLPEGKNDLVIVQIGRNGTESPPVDVVVVIDTTVPNKPVDVVRDGGNGSPEQPSNNNRPVFSGKDAEPGATVELRDANGNVIGSTTVKSDGTWSVSPDNDLPDGENHITIVIKDGAGNESPPVDVVVIIDTGKPDAPEDIVLDNVEVQPGQTTNNNRPVFSGTGEPGARIELRDADGNVLGSTIVGDDRKWTLQPDEPLRDGQTGLVIVQIDNAGNTSPGVVVVVDVDTVPPTVPSTVPTTPDNNSPQPGIVGTDNTRPGIYIGVGVTDTPTLYVDGVEVPSVYDPVTGILRPAHDLPEGEHTLSYTLTDPAGNNSDPSGGLVLIVDTTAPVQTTSIVVTDAVGVITGPVGENAYSNDRSPTISGTLSADLGTNELVGIWRNDVLVGTATANNKIWSWDDDGLDDDQYTYIARVIDAAGNLGPSASHTFYVDATVPTQTTTLVVTDLNGRVTGPIADGGYTNDKAPELSGVLTEPLGENEFLAISRGGVLLETISVSSSDNSWRWTDSDLSDGRHTYTIGVVDRAGNWKLSTDHTINVDTSAPDQPTMIDNARDDEGRITGTLTNGATTDDTSPRLSGTLSGPLAGGDYIEVLRNGMVIGTGTVNGTGWSYQDGGLGDGSYAYRVRWVDVLGNATAVGDQFQITVDATAPQQGININTAFDDHGLVTGSIFTGSTTDDTSPLLEGTLTGPLESDAIMEVLRNGTVIGTAGVSGTNWSFQDDGLTDGETYEYAVRLVDSVGNESALSAKFELKISASALRHSATIDDIVDDEGRQTGPVPNGAATNDTSPRLSGSISEALNADEVLEVLRNGVVIGTADVSGTGWVFQEDGLSNGVTYNYRVQVRDQVGNTSAASSTHTIIIDTSSPTQTTAIAVRDSTGWVSGLVGNNDYTNDTKPVLSGVLLQALQAGEYVEVLRNGTVIGVADTTASNWSYQEKTDLTDSSYTYRVRVVDAAGNEGPLSDAFVINVDTVAPTKTTSMTIEDDTGWVLGPVPDGGVTNDTEPKLSGVLSAALAVGEFVGIWRDDVLVDTITVVGTNWNWDDTGLVDGRSYKYTAGVIDIAGNVATTQAPQTITIDTTPPSTAVPSLVVTSNVGVMSGTVSNNDYTNDTEPTLSGEFATALAANEVVAIFRATNGGVSEFIGTVTADGTRWEWTDKTGLLNGSSYTYTVQVMDTAGNLSSGASRGQTINVDTVAPTRTVTELTITDDVGDQQGPVLNGEYTNDIAPKLTGKLSARLGTDESVGVWRDNVYLGTATITGTGWDWEWDDKNLEEGSHEYTVRVIDSAGNEGPSPITRTIIVDVSAPTQTTTLEINDNVDPRTGAVEDDVYTNDTSPELSGTLSAALGENETVAIFRSKDDGSSQYVGTATVDVTNWSWKWTHEAGLVDGSNYTYTVRVMDKAGNLGSETTLKIYIDATNPTETATISNITDDQAPQTGVVLNDGFTNDNKPRLSGAVTGALGAGEVVQILRDNVVVGSVAVSGTGWNWEDDLSTDGTYKYRVQVIDRAGNVSALSGERILHLDREAPTAPTILAMSNSLGGDFRTANDFVVFSGRGEAGSFVEILRGGVSVGTATVSSTGIWQSPHVSMIDVSTGANVTMSLPGSNISTLPELGPTGSLSTVRTCWIYPPQQMR